MAKLGSKSSRTCSANWTACFETRMMKLMGHRESIPSEKFDELLRGANRRIFRMESLPEYNVPDDRVICDQFLRGVPLPPLDSPEIKEWDEMIRNYRKRGISFDRLRLMPETITPYLRYEIDWVYSYTAGAGEETRFWPIKKSSPTLQRDFYVLDDATVIHLEYDQSGRWTGFSFETDSAYARDLIAGSSQLWNSAMKLEEFLASYRSRIV